MKLGARWMCWEPFCLCCRTWQRKCVLSEWHWLQLSIPLFAGFTALSEQFTAEPECCLSALSSVKHPGWLAQITRAQDYSTCWVNFSFQSVKGWPTTALCPKDEMNFGCRQTPRMCWECSAFCSGVLGVWCWLRLKLFERIFLLQPVVHFFPPEGKHFVNLARLQP